MGLTGQWPCPGLSGLPERCKITLGLVDRTHRSTGSVRHCRENGVEKPHKRRSVAMMKLMTRMTTVILALVLVLPTIGCQEKGRERESERDRVSEREKPHDVQIDAGPVKVKVEGSRKPDEKDRHIDVGPTEVKVEGTKKPDEKDRHIDVEVERHPGQESGDRNK